MMARAVKLAWRGRYTTHPNPRVGCVVVHSGEVVGEGWHEHAGLPHAEAVALQMAGGQARGSTVYVTLEPCSHFGRTPPCADALVEAGVSRVVIAMQDPNPAVAGRGVARLRDAGIAVTEAVLAGEAETLNPGFLKRMRSKQPYVRVKVAASLDGRTAMASGESQWITGPAARQDVQRLRAMSAAIVTGAGTVLADDPSLTVRPDEMGALDEVTTPVSQPLRVIVDRQLRTPGAARILKTGRVWIICDPAHLDSPGAQALRQAGAELHGVEVAGNHVRLDQVLSLLARHGINEVLVEAGPGLAGAFVDASLLDELWLYQAPVFLGSNGLATVTLPIEQMADKRRWQVRDRRLFGDDQRLIMTLA
jgi:diaminohydroxyphosphoribosylaminopyrimidine deaminase/5-amino-6-(5-phosphoribosylamino)uracil reductase